MGRRNMPIADRHMLNHVKPLRERSSKTRGSFSADRTSKKQRPKPEQKRIAELRKSLGQVLAAHNASQCATKANTKANEGNIENKYNIYNIIKIFIDIHDRNATHCSKKNQDSPVSMP